jgi:holin-like protein
MLLGFLLLLLGYWLGDAVSTALQLPVPGAVLGMALVAIVLRFVHRTPTGLERAADGLLQQLPLLFVPAGVGVVQFLAPLRAAWLPVVLTLVGGTLLTVAVTALSLRACLAWQQRHRAEQPRP